MAVSAAKRALQNPSTPSADRSKRPRTAPKPTQYASLKDATFPAPIAAHIDQLLMTGTEALVEAGSSSQVKWLNQLLARFTLAVANALAAVAAKCHQEAVEILIDALLDPGRKKVGQPLAALLEAAVAAGGHGHLRVLKLLPRKIALGSLQQSDKKKVYTAAGLALNKAARHGHLAVVKALVQFARKHGFTKSIGPGWRALSCAVAGRHRDIVEYLFALEGVQWDLAAAFAAALDTKQSALAQRIVDVYPESFPTSSLLVHLAHNGHTNAVKFIYNTTPRNIKAINTAFVRAATRHKTDTAAFLLSTHHVSGETFDRAFVAAAGPTGGFQLDTVMFLYYAQRPSATAINEAFKLTDSAALIDELFKKERIASESIVAVFGKAAGCGGVAYSNDSDRAKIVKLLSHERCIPDEMIDEAFLAATGNKNVDVVKFLRYDRRVSTETFGEAFASAAESGNYNLMQAVYDETRVSQEDILVAFTKSLALEKLEIVRFLVKLLTDEEHVSPAIKHRAFVSAATCRYPYTLQLLTRTGTGDWPLDVLKEAHCAAVYCATRNFISRLTCEQLFDPTRDDRLQAMVVWMADWEED